MKNKKVYRVRAKSLDSQGRGVVSFNHSMIPVPGLLPGELAQIVLYRKGDETLGRILSIVEKSGERAEGRLFLVSKVRRLSALVFEL